MLVGIISDTHDHVPHIKRAVAMFRNRKVNLVIHAGDYCSPFTVPLFEGLPLHGILGNNDGDHYLLMQKFTEINATLHGEFFEWEADGLSCAIYHGTYQPITEALRTCGTYDVVITGHTHQTVHKKYAGTLAINPGTAHGFEKEATIAFLETEDLKVEFAQL